MPSVDDVIGGRDRRIQAYNFRLCVTKSPDRVPFSRPDTYNKDRFELLRRYINACYASNATCQLGYPSCNTAPVPSGKYDMNNCGGISSDYIGGSDDYPEANYSYRKEIWEDHLNYQQGLLWTLANDEAIPSSVRAEMGQWGLCADEFVNNSISPHWPPGLYVLRCAPYARARVFTQNTPTEGSVGKNSIGLGSYNFDSHNARRLACINITSCKQSGPKGVGLSASYSWNEGDVEINPGIYQIPSWVMYPRRAQATNLLVVSTLSASHIGLSTLRMEPQFMIIGEAAGINAAMASQQNVNVQDVDPQSMYDVLAKRGAKLVVVDGNGES